MRRPVLILLLVAGAVAVAAAVRVSFENYASGAGPSARGLTSAVLGVDPRLPTSATFALPTLAAGAQEAFDLQLKQRANTALRLTFAGAASARDLVEKVLVQGRAIASGALSHPLAFTLGAAQARSLHFVFSRPRGSPGGAPTVTLRIVPLQG